MTEIVIKLPNKVDKSLIRLIRRAVRKELLIDALFKELEKELKNSELTDEDIEQLEKKVKNERRAYWRERLGMNTSEIISLFSALEKSDQSPRT